MLYVNVCLSRSRPCLALHPPVACACQSLGPLACVVASIPPRACLDVTTCEIHLRGVGVLDTHFSPFRVMLICLPCATHLSFFASFASLNACLHVHAWVCMSFILQSNGIIDTWSKPTFVLLGHPLLFDNMLVCPFICLACFVWPCLAFFVSMFFARSPHLICFFLCLFASILLLSLHVHAWNMDTWSKGATD